MQRSRAILLFGVNIGTFIDEKQSQFFMAIHGTHV